MIQVTPIPAFKDNYLWLVEGHGETWVVDPGDGEAVKKALNKQSKTLSGILVTHHHWDHVNGIESLSKDGMRVAGPAQNRFPLVNQALCDGEKITLCGTDFQVIEVPGHTLNHIAYFAEPEGQAPILLCGDTLFAGGCGRLFEGTPAQMHQSLTRLSKLPKNTQIYCAHEYTLANLSFAQTLEPGNQALNERVVQATSLRQRGIPTIPSTLSVELDTNPFLRVHSEELIQSARTNNPKLSNQPEAIFAQIRSMKDSF